MPMKKLFKRAFRQASPMIGERSRDFDSNCCSDEEEDSIGELSDTAFKRMTESIERLTESARRESFSSISSAGVRQQFVTALSNLQNEVFADIERNLCESEQNTIIHKRLDSAINSTDTRITQAQTATTTTVQYSSITPITMDSNATNSTRQQNAQHSNLGFSYEENIIDLDSPMEQTGPNVTPSRPIQTSSSGAIGNMLATGSASSHDSEDSNGFVRIEHPATDLLGDFDHPFGEVPLVPERSEHDVSRGEMTPSDETSSLSSDMDQHHVLPKASELAESAFERVTDAAAAGRSKVSDAATAASDAAKSAFGTVGDAAYTAYESAVDTAKAAEGKTSAAAHNIFGTVTDTAKAAQEKASEAAHNVFGAASETARATQDKTAEAAHAAYGTAADTIKLAEEKASEAAGAASGLIGDTIHLVHEKADDAYGGVTSAVKGAKEATHDAYGVAAGAAKDLYSGAKGGAQGVHDTVTGAAHEAADDVYGALSGATEAVKQKAHDAAAASEAAYSAGVDAAHAIGEKGREAVGFTEKAIEDEYDKLSDAAHAAYGMTTGAVKGATETVEGAAHGAHERVADAAHSAYEMTSGTLKDAGEAVGGAAHTAYDTASGALKGAGEMFEGAAHTAYDTASGAMKGAGDELGGAAHAAYDMAYGAVKGADEAIEGAAHDAAKKLEGGGEAGIEKVKEFAHAAGEEFDLFDPLKKSAEKVHDTSGESFQDNIRSEVAGIHDQIDSMIQKMHEDAAQSRPTEEVVGLSSESSAFGRGSSPDEHTFDRKGPLTIPSTKEQKPDDSHVHLGDERKAQGGFDGMEPRPPTPPKELDDEDVKPTTIDVGPPPPYKSSIASDRPRSILKHSGQGPWFDFKSVDPRLLDLIYWRNPKKSAVVLSLTILLLLVFAKYPLITVLSYLGLAVLGGTLGFRLYKIAEAQLRKTDGANPFQPYLEKELTMPQERVHQQVDVLIEHGQVVVNQLRRLFLVENIAESAKFGLLLWALTYVGSWFSGLCILLLVVLGIFSIPKFYETYQEPIDRNLGVAKEQVNNITNTMHEKLPFLKKVTGCAHEKTN